MRTDSLTGWPLIALSSLFAGILLLNGAVFAYRQTLSPGLARASSEQRIAALESKIADLERRQSRSSLERFNEVRVGGEFVGFRERGGSFVQGVIGNGSSDLPVGYELPEYARAVLAGPPGIQ